MAAVADQTRSNYVGAASIDDVDGSYVIRVNAPSLGYRDIDTSFAWFPYDEWLGGFANNSTNGGSITSFISGGRLTYGTSLFPYPNLLDQGGGQFRLDLRPVDSTATAQNGVLLAMSANGEDNYAQVRDNADGTFNIYSRDSDVGANNSNRTISFEQDPIAFVYIPFDAVDTTELVAAGRVRDLGGVPQVTGAGTYQITKGSTGVWYLTIAGHDNTTGNLIVCPETTGVWGISCDNLASFEWDGINNRWVIISHDLPSTALNRQNGPDNEDMFSFAFFAKEPDPIPKETFENLYLALDPDGDDNNNGLSNFEDYAAGFDPNLPVSLDIKPQIQLGAEGTIELTNSLRLTEDDVVVRWDRTSDLINFTDMIEGEDYEIIETQTSDGARGTVRIRILFDIEDETKQFFVPRYIQALPQE